MTYTPSTEEIIEEWIVGTVDEPESRAQFDRWLAEYTRQQREEAFDEGWLERSLVVDVPVWENPYRKVES